MEEVKEKEKEEKKEKNEKQKPTKKPPPKKTDARKEQVTITCFLDKPRYEAGNGMQEEE